MIYLNKDMVLNTLRDLTPDVIDNEKTEEIYNRMKMAQSVVEKIPGWIPRSKKETKDSLFKKYLVTIDDGLTKYIEIMMYHEGFGYVEMDEWKNNLDRYVTAWMPLCEVYNG